MTTWFAQPLCSTAVPNCSSRRSRSPEAAAGCRAKLSELGSSGFFHASCEAVMCPGVGGLWCNLKGTAMCWFHSNTYRALCYAQYDLRQALLPPRGRGSWWTDMAELTCSAARLHLTSRFRSEKMVPMLPGRVATIILVSAPTTARCLPLPPSLSNPMNPRARLHQSPSVYICCRCRCTGLYMVRLPK